MLPPLADPSDLEAWLGRGTFATVDYTRAATVIDYVSSLIRREAGDTWVDEDGFLTELPDGIPGLCVTVSARVWDNPTFKQSITTGPFADTFGPQHGLYLTDEEKALLPASGTTTLRGIGTLSTTRGPVETYSGTGTASLSAMLDDPDL